MSQTTRPFIPVGQFVGKGSKKAATDAAEEASVGGKKFKVVQSSHSGFTTVQGKKRIVVEAGKCHAIQRVK